MRREITKVFLYAYPMLEDLRGAMLQAAQNKAALSFREEGERAAERVLGDLAAGEYLARLKEETDDILRSLGEEERFLLDYKYFHMETARCGEQRAVGPERSYFRRQNALFEKMHAAYVRNGWSEKRFLREFGAFAPFLKLLRAVRAGREQTITPRRERRGVSFQKSASSGGGACRLPRSTSAATPTATAQTAQMRTICRTEGPEGEGDSAGGSVSPPAGVSSGTVR